MNPPNGTCCRAHGIHARAYDSVVLATDINTQISIKLEPFKWTRFTSAPTPTVARGDDRRIRLHTNTAVARHDYCNAFMRCIKGFMSERSTRNEKYSIDPVDYV